ncbi:MAG: PfkB family carbohydrate kinase [Acetivibrionales bacterium]|jgi:fructokinase
MIDITVLGEILIDFTPAGTSSQGNILFERNPGGAPANVAVCVARLGGKAGFIGKVGKDMFGHFLSSVLKDNGVLTSGLKFANNVNTTLAFVQLDENGDRSFSFYRNPGADTALEPSEIDYSLIKDSKVFHFGSLSLTDEPARSATHAALEFAKENGCIISYDPNLRPPLWKDMEFAKKQIESVMGYCDILKISEEEMEFLTGEKCLEKGTAAIHGKYRTPLILVTRGAEGSYYRLGDFTGNKPTFKEFKPVDTTGAGDSFLGGFLYSMLSRGIDDLQKLDVKVLEDLLVFANAAASLCVTKKGAIPAMPDLESVMKVVQGR